MRRWLPILVVLIACGDDAPMMECVSEAPVIECPMDMDLGCIEGTETVRFRPLTRGCGGGSPTVTCTPESGTSIAGNTTVSCIATNDFGVAECSFEIAASPGARLTCPAALTMACTGERTPVAVPDPIVDEMCGEVGELTDDAPAEGFVVGETTVRFDSVGGESCTVPVQVEDLDPPTLDCPETLVVLPSTELEMIDVPPIAVSDVCDPAPTIVAEPPTVAPGSTDVTITATDASGQSSVCDTTVEVRFAFAPHSLRVMSAQLDGDDTTDVTLAWDSGGGDDLSGFAIQRGTGSPEDPFETIESVGAGQRTVTIADVAEPTTFRVVALAGEAEGGASDEVLAYPIDATGYDIRGVDVPGIPLAGTTLYGVVRHPRDLGEGPFPLVLMLHGNHGICRRTPTSDQDSCALSTDHECPQPGWFTTPNAEGLAYLAETVAAQGYVAVSISGNAVNCRNDWIAERAALLRAHLERWMQFAGGGAPFDDRFVGALDLSRVALFGHSRGGEAVATVPALLETSPVSGVNVVSVFSLAPTDFGEPAPVDVAYGVLLPGCDGDVQFLFGTDIYDRSIRSDDGFPRAQLLMAGANHNYFNTEWRIDDNDGRACANSTTVGAPAQRAAMEGVFGTWLAATVGGAGVEPYVRAEAGVPEGIDAWAGTALDWRWSYHAERLRVAELEIAGAPDTNLLGEPNEFTDFETASQCFDNDCGNRYPHEKGAMLLSWDGTTPIASFGVSGDTGDWSHVTFRVVSRRSTFNAGVDHTVFGVRVHAGGESAVISSIDYTLVPHLYPARDPLEIFQTVRIPLMDYGFDTSAITAIDVEMSGTGSVLLSDVALSR